MDVWIRSGRMFQVMHLQAKWSRIQWTFLSPLCFGVVMEGQRYIVPVLHDNSGKQRVNFAKVFRSVEDCMCDDGAASSTSACSAVMKTRHVFLTYPEPVGPGHCYLITSQLLLGFPGVLQGHPEACSGEVGIVFLVLVDFHGSSI